MKLFISQPMRDKTDEEIKAERERILKEVRAEYPDADEIKSFFESAPHDATPLYFLGESIKLLGTADIVYFAPGWNDYRGCRTEHFICKEYDIKIVND